MAHIAAQRTKKTIPTDPPIVENVRSLHHLSDGGHIANRSATYNGPQMSEANDRNSPGEKNPPPTINAAVRVVTITLFVLILLAVLSSQNDPTGSADGIVKTLAGIITFIFDVFGHVR